MSFTFLEVATTMSTVAGAVTVLTSLIAQFRAIRRARRDVASLGKAQEENALNSADINVVGAYLIETIGSVRIGDYVRDDKVRKQTTSAMRRITDFLTEGSDKRVDLTDRPEAPDELVSTAPDELMKAEQSIRSGEVWNGLARTRRYIEEVLRERLQSPNDKFGAGRLLSMAEKSGAIPEEATQQLRYAIKVANAAIHGEEVDEGVALEALQSARYGLEIIQRAA